MIVFVLRHADRTAGDELSQAGRERAKLLARMLAESGVGIVYHSDALRAARTVEPLKARLGSALAVEPVGFPEPDGISRHIDHIVQSVRSQAGGAVIAVVSHSNTVGPILERLGSDPIEPIADSEFDKLFVLFRGANAPPSLLKLRYGAPTP